MKDPKIVHIGVDVSKDSLRLDGDTLFVGEVPNTAPTIRSMLKKLQKKVEEGEILHICLEATGPYGDLLVGECRKADIRVSVLNPAKVRHYAKAISETAKTDPIDARVIRCFAEARQPMTTPAPSEEEVELRKLVLAREALVKCSTELCGTLESVEGSQAGSVLKQALAGIKKKITKLEHLIQETTKRNEKLSGLTATLCKITGVGEITVATTLAYVPEIGTLGRRRSASIAGLAPYIRDSGRFKGKTFISGGRPQIRRALFMPATVARVHNPVLKEVYERMRANGKPYKVVMTAIMRRLFCHMDAVAAAWLAEQNSVARATPVTAT